MMKLTVLSSYILVKSCFYNVQLTYGEYQWQNRLNIQKQ